MKHSQGRHRFMPLEVSSRVRRATAGVLAGALMAAALPAIVPASASAAAANYQGSLTSVTSVELNPDQANQVIITFDSDGTTIEGRMTFLEDGIIHYVVDPSGNFNPYATPNSSSHTARIQAQPDDDGIYETPAAVDVNDGADAVTITAGDTTVTFSKDTALMTIADGEKTVMQETSPIQFNGNATVQTLAKGNAENFFGGGMQNGRFIHTGNTINIANESNWVDGGVASPNPFYWSSEGYGVLRNTFASGSYNFGNGQDVVTATHNDNKYDAYIFVSDDSDAGVTTVAQDLLTEYYTVTGNPALIPDYAFYVGHYNAYNRDSWSDTAQNGYGSGWPIYGHSSYASGEYDSISYEKGGTGAAMSANEHVESLNGHGPSIYTDNIPEGVDFPYEFSAQAKLNGYQDYDMPLGYFLPNDGYGAGYGQNGYNMTGGVNADGSSSEARLEAVAANVENLKEFADYADAHGVATGLWTQSNLSPDSNSNTLWQTLRDFEAEVRDGGVTMLKTDVAWVGPGYSFSLNGVKTAYDNVTTLAGERPLIVSLDGWAGTQRFASIWSGDQTGGNWEYIRFHIPTFIGQGLAGNPYMGSDMDGIFGGHPIVATRDYQWKSFVPLMLDMDGWGSYAKMPYTYGDPYTGINRMYLKIKAQLLPYLYTTAASASNVEDWTGNDDLGLPMVRAILLSDDSEYAASTATQYEFTLGEDFLVAPIYQNTDGDTANGGLGDGDDVRNNIYLPGDESTIWIDYWTGDQYTGGQVLNNFNAPIWKLPIFVKANAIIPMYEENNNPEPITEDNPEGTDRTKRIVEFYAIDGENDYTLYEDDGTYIENTTDSSDAEYGVQDNISYGPHVETTFSSKVDGDTATFTAGQSDGTYTGYDSNRTTTFVVNVSAEPSSVEAKNGDQVLTQEKVDSKEAFDAATPAAGEAIYFYDETPNLNSNAYSDDGGVQSEEFTKTEIISSPKLYVKFAKTDVAQNAQTLVIKGFANEGDLPENVLNENLATPANLAAPEDQKTPTSIALAWDAVEGATSYELKVDGVVFSIGGATTYNHTDLSYNSTHTYQVRARNDGGYSEWSGELRTASLQDPWRNVPTPTNIDWEGGIYSNRTEDKAFDHELQTGDGGFHSDGNNIGQTMTIDYGLAYDFDTMEYYPRDDAGNGTVTSMKIETSLDGVNWTVISEATSWSQDGIVKTVQFPENTFARYVRLTPLSSVGGFFSASEIAIYKADGSSGFEVGSLPSAPYTVGNEDVQHLEGNALGRENREPIADEFRTHVASKAFDINNNGVYDVYDMSFTMSKVYDGTTKTGAVDGSIAVIPSATSVKTGDVVTVDLYVSDATNVNALGSVIHFDGTKFELVADSIEGSAYIAGMEDESSSTTTFTDGTQTVNLAFVNEGDKALYNGTGVMATFQLKALADTDVTLSSTSWLVGPACDAKVVESDGTAPELPERPTVESSEYSQDAFDITITNSALPTDDGNNVTTLIQGGSFAPLFDNVKYHDGSSGSGTMELKWNTAVGDQTVFTPLSLHFAFKQASALDSVVLINRVDQGGSLVDRGSVKKLSGVINFQDGSKQKFSGGEFDTQKASYTLAVSAENKGKLVSSVDINIDETSATNLMTISEIDFNYTTSAVTVDSIELGENETELYTGELARVDAKAVTADDIYPYVNVSSSDPSVASVTSVADADGNIVWYVRGNKAGAATITVASALDGTKTAAYEVTVIEGVDTSALEQAISDAGSYAASAYTEESYAALQEAVKAGQDLIAPGGSYSANDVASAAVAIQDAIDALEMRPVDESTLINTSAETDVTVVGQSSQMPASSGEDGEVDNVLDYDDQSYWHSNYINADYMPQYLIFDLGAEYDLTDVTFLPRQNGTNGDIFEVEILTAASAEDLQAYADNGYEATADSTVASLGTFSYDNNGRTLTDRTEWQQAAFAPQTTQYVMFKVNHSGGDVQDQYCSASEIRFYGTKPATSEEKGALQAKVDEILAENLDEKKYTDETWTELKLALDDAQRLLVDDGATKTEVDQALKRLTAARQNLKETEIPSVEKPDKSALQELVDQVKDTDLSGKTEETADLFTSALKGAQEVLANDDATEAQIEAAWNELKAAYDGLKPATEQPGGDDQKPGGDDQKPGGDTTKPGDDGQQGGSQQGGSGQQGDGLAQTSDPTSFVAVLATALAGAGALAISRKRR